MYLQSAQISCSLPLQVHIIYLICWYNVTLDSSNMIEHFFIFSFLTINKFTYAFNRLNLKGYYYYRALKCLVHSQDRNWQHMDVPSQHRLQHLCVITNTPISCLHILHTCRCGVLGFCLLKSFKNIFVWFIGS